MTGRVFAVLAAQHGLPGDLIYQAVAGRLATAQITFETFDAGEVATWRKQLRAAAANEAAPRVTLLCGVPRDLSTRRLADARRYGYHTLVAPIKSVDRQHAAPIAQHYDVPFDDREWANSHVRLCNLEGSAWNASAQVIDLPLIRHGTADELLGLSATMCETIIAASMTR